MGKPDAERMVAMNALYEEGYGAVRYASSRYCRITDWRELECILGMQNDVREDSKDGVEQIFSAGR